MSTHSNTPEEDDYDQIRDELFIPYRQRPVLTDQERQEPQVQRAVDPEAPRRGQPRVIFEDSVNSLAESLS